MSTSPQVSHDQARNVRSARIVPGWLGAFGVRLLFPACVAGVAGCTEYGLVEGTDPERFRDDPDIAVEPGAIAFGLVPAGEEQSEVVRIGNEGSDDLTVNHVVVSGGAREGYGVTLDRALPWVLAPSESRDVVVTFAPEDTALVAGTLSVLSDDPDEPEVRVPLSNETWLPCDDAYSDTMPWKESGLWYGDTQPTDTAGRPWTASAFDDSGWDVLDGLPDAALGTEYHDVFYRAVFSLEAVEGTTEVEFQGNDGVWLYVNETYVGHWGGEWRQGGCINDTTGDCSVNYEVPPIDVTPWLVPGPNLFAVMLTNGPSGYWLDIRATCTE